MMTDALLNTNVFCRDVFSVIAPVMKKKINVPAGRYYVLAVVRSNTTGASTTAILGDVRQFVDANQVQVSDLPLLWGQPSENNVVATRPFTAGQKQNVFHLEHSTLPSTACRGVHIPHGLQITATKGSATDGEEFEVELIFVKMG